MLRNYSGYSLNSTVSVVLGNGDGTFQAAVDYSTGDQASNNGGVGADSIVAADFNNDGFLDLATLDKAANEVSIFLNKGDGTFQGPTFAGYAFTDLNAEQPLQLAATDFNKDGRMDLVFVADGQSGAGVLMGNGDSTFKPAVTYVTDVDAAGVAVGDLNGDGNPDFVVSTTANNTLTIVLGKGDGTFHDARNYVPWVISNGNFDSGAAPSPVSVAFGDFNGDGKPDRS